jgi:hypothetical protein
MPLLQLTATAAVDSGEVWLITDDGLVVFVDPALAPFLEETVLSAARGVDASISFLLAHDVPAAMPLKTRRSGLPNPRRVRRRRPRLDGA